MKKNGITFSSVVDYNELIPGTWDPFYYKTNFSKNALGNYVEVSKQFNTKFAINTFEYSPIEYRDIPQGNSVVFNLNKNYDTGLNRCFAVPENTLLLGTMRAYLGNIIVTPKSTWISKRKIWFPINSEFCEIVPQDDLKYFWWAFLKSPSFLNNLPTGTGGTRPRVTAEQLNRIPVLLPKFEERQRINSSIEAIAKRMWEDQISLQEITHF